MAEVPKGLPSKLSDDDLEAAIGDWIAEYRTIYPTSKLPELILAFVNTASQEQAAPPGQSRLEGGALDRGRRAPCLGPVSDRRAGEMKWSSI